MSIHLVLQALKSAHVKQVLEDPSSARAFTYGPAGSRQQTVERLRKMGAPPNVLDCFPPPPDDLLPQLRVGQTWQAIGWLLRQDAEKKILRHLDLATAGGREVGRADAAGWGYGLPTLLLPAEVAAVAAALASRSVDQVMQHFDHARMISANVYLAESLSDPAGQQWLRTSLSELIDYYNQARAHGHGMLRVMV